jgi:protein-disulfide isomerase
MRAVSMHPFRRHRIAYDPRFCTSDPRKAKVVVAAFSEFMCPVCAVVLPWLRTIVSAFGRRVALCYKFFPTSGHGRAGVMSCAAAAAAGFQGKFWPMHDLLYRNRKRLGPRHLEGYARAVGLDLKRFRVERTSPAAGRLVLGDKAAGLRLGVMGTPTLFLDGKRYRGWKNRVEIADRIAEELHLRAGGR